jgi:serine/threonine protein phosphatase PrpC
MDYALLSIIGKRENQEDYGVIKSSGSSGGVLAVIADGMGGQVAGEVASSSAVNRFVESFTSNNSKNLPLKLTVALDKANRSLANSIANNPKFNGMGATLIAAHIESDSINWISVGDSILFLYRDKKLQRLNDDHSMIPVLNESVRSGKMTHEEARVHPHRNALRSALTGEEIPMVNLREEPLRLIDGDLIVLATDGILTLSEYEIGSILEQYKVQPAKVIAARLLESVTLTNKPRQDNTFVEVIKATGGRKNGFKWADSAMTISIILIVCLLASFAWEYRKTILQAFGIVSEQELTNPKTEGSKVVPLSVDPNSTNEKTEVNPADQTAPQSSVDSPTISKNNKTSPDKRSPATIKTGKPVESKASQKVDASAKPPIPDVQSSTSAGGINPDTAGTSIVPGVPVTPPVASPPAKTDSAPNSDGERAPKSLEADITPKGKAE